MSLHSVKITAPDKLGAATRIEIDGEQSNVIAGLTFRATPDSWARVELDVFSQVFEFDGNAVVTIKAETAALLVKLGWTPPQD